MKTRSTELEDWFADLPRRRLPVLGPLADRVRHANRMREDPQYRLAYLARPVVEFHGHYHGSTFCEEEHA